MKICLIFGGKSAEHNVSICSAANIFAILKNLNHDIFCIGIDKNGLWHYHEVTGKFPDCVDINGPIVSLELGCQNFTFRYAGKTIKINVDIVFPILHGPMGEDGTIQGLCAISNIPIVGSKTLSSAIAMDKDITKRLLKGNKLPVTPWIACRYGQIPRWEEVEKKLGKRIFVKPANLGSSIGISKASKVNFIEAIKKAFFYSHKVILEKEVKGREIECGILKTESRLEASVLGEIILSRMHSFYDYNAKYGRQKYAKLIVPAIVEDKIIDSIRTIAVQAFECLELDVYARVDFFLTEQNDIIINELNTIPGFTDLSLYLKMFAASGFEKSRIIEIMLTQSLQGSK